MSAAGTGAPPLIRALAVTVSNRAAATRWAVTHRVVDDGVAS